jgi:glycosyltransferase involved in cell wall biosynthesis
VILEAISCGLPVVTVREGGIPEIMTNILFGQMSDRNQSHYSKLINNVLMKKETSNDATARNQLMKSGWSWDKSVLQLEEILKKTLK